MTLLVLLGILLGTCGLLSLADRARGGVWLSPAARGRISLAALFLFTGMGHFVKTDEMVAMLPAWAPSRHAIVYVTGLLEWAGAIGLLVPRFSRAAGICLVVFMVMIFPANVYAAWRHVEMGGHGAGPIYLIVRGPFQLLLIWWAWFFAVRRAPAPAAPPPEAGPRRTD
ncbi:MAG: DoxX family protein [Candidatus Polarisedimenticolia bacterium]